MLQSGHFLQILAPESFCFSQLLVELVNLFKSPYLPNECLRTR